MHLLAANNAKTTIAGPISSTSTTITLATGTGSEFPVIVAGQYFAATLTDALTGLRIEIVYVTARVGDVCTVVRAQEGTTAQAYSGGDIFGNLFTAGSFEALTQFDDLQEQTGNFAVDTGTANSVVITLSPVPASLPTSLNAIIGSPIRVRKVGAANTGPTNITINGFAAVPCILPGGTAAAFPSGQLAANAVFEGVLDGLGNFEILSGGVSGLGTAAFKNASNGSVPNVASIVGAVSTGHFAIYADTNGSIKDGGVPGTAAFLNATDGSATLAVGLIGSVVSGNVPYFSTGNGSVSDSGIPILNVLTTTSNLNGITNPAIARQNIGILTYRTGNYTPTAGAGYSESHTLGAPPSVFSVSWFLQCLVSNGGYSVGEITPFPVGGSSGLSPAVTISFTSTTIFISINSTITIALVTKGGGGAFNITVADWEIFAILEYNV